MPDEDRPPLSRDLILRTAIELADAQGVSAVTMRAIASRLGVEAMSLYHHVADKEHLLDGMVDLVFAEVNLPRSDRDWRPEIRRRSLSGRDALTRHAWAVSLMDSRAAPGPNTLRHHDAVIGCLRAGGFSLRLAAHAFALLDAHLYGFVIQETSLPFQGTAEMTELATGLVAEMAGTYPSLTDLAEQLVLQPGYTFAAEFEYGLDLILDGLDQRRAADEPPAPARSTAPGTYVWAPAPS